MRKADADIVGAVGREAISGAVHRAAQRIAVIVHATAATSALGHAGADIASPLAATSVTGFELSHPTLELPNLQPLGLGAAVDIRDSALGWFSDLIDSQRNCDRQAAGRIRGNDGQGHAVRPLQ